MKTIATSKTAMIPAAIFAAATFGLSSGTLAAAADDIASDAAHSLAYKFALEEQAAADAKQLSAKREAAQLAAEKAAMEAAQRAAIDARAEAELKAYRDDLLQRAKREAENRRKGDAATRKAELAKKRARENARKKAQAARAKAAAEVKALAEAEAKRLQDKRLAEMQKARDRELNLLDQKLQGLKEQQEARRQARELDAKRKTEAAKKLAAARAADAKAAKTRQAAQRRKLKARQAAKRLAQKQRRASRALAAKRAAAKKLARQRVARERVARQRVEQERVARQRVARQRVALERAAAETLAQERAEQEWLQQQRLAQQRFAAEERLNELRRTRQGRSNAANHRRQLDRAIAAAEQSVASRSSGRKIANHDASQKAPPPAWANGYARNRSSDSRFNRNDAQGWANKPAPGGRDVTGTAPTHVSGHHATVLLVMKPGNRGIRRINKTADPVLCTSGGCYISQGADQPALFVSRRRALGMRNTFGRRAGACNQRLGCIFRNVDLSRKSAILQPVDLRMVHHDRRRAQLVKAPKTCTITGRLQDCCETYRARDYVMLVIPEEVAASVSPRALQDMLSNSMMSANPRASSNAAAGVPRYN